MPTPSKAQFAIQNMVENGGNASQAMKQAGYSDAYAKNPHKFTQTKQYQQLLQEYLSEEFILQSLKEDITSKPGNRLGELTLAAKLLGLDKKTPNPNNGTGSVVFLPIENDTDRDYISRFKAANPRQLAIAMPQVMVDRMKMKDAHE